jgi:hypothetical protein
LKKVSILLALLLLLTGCGGNEVFERVEDVYAPVAETPKKLALSLPKDAAVATVSGSSGTLYLCDGYTVAVETLSGGDLNRTFKTITGFSSDRLTVMAREKDGITAYRCVWTSAGEGGDQVGRSLILDDGAFHYAVTVMASASDATALQDAWQSLFQSVTLRTD